MRREALLLAIAPAVGWAASIDGRGYPSDLEAALAMLAMAALLAALFREALLGEAA